MAAKVYDAESKKNLMLVVTLTRALQSLNRAEAKVINSYDLTMPQFGVLEILYHKGPMRICTIIEKTLSTGGNMTVIIENLIKRGLASRRPDESDRRASLVSLTAEGKALIAEVFTEHIENLRGVLRHLSSDEKDTLIEKTRKLGLAITDDLNSRHS